MAGLSRPSLRKVSAIFNDKFDRVLIRGGREPGTDGALVGNTLSAKAIYCGFRLVKVTQE